MLLWGKYYCNFALILLGIIPEDPQSGPEEVLRFYTLLVIPQCKDTRVKVKSCIQNSVLYYCILYKDGHYCYYYNSLIFIFVF